MAPVEEADFAGTGVSLYRRSVAPTAVVAWARLGILPGYGDHSGRYVEFMRWMAARGVACHAMDFRGHGHASGRRGYVRRWGEFLDDLRAFLDLPALGEGPHRAAPLFLLGHSHGGLVLAVAGTRGLAAGMAGCVLCSPYLRGATPVPLHRRVVGRVANVVLPWVRLRTGLRDNCMSSDPAMVEDSRRDPLLLHVATPRWYFSTAAAQREAMRLAPRFRLPMMCLIGSADRVADPTAAEVFCAAAGSADKTFHLLPGQLHELLREARRELTFTLILDWLRERAGPRAVPV